MSGADTASAGRLRLDEGTPALPAPVMDSSDEFDIDPAALTGQESIDWTTLRPPCAQRWMPRAASPRRRSYSVSCTSHAVVMSSAYGRWLPTMAMSTTARAGHGAGTHQPWPVRDHRPYLAFREDIPAPAPLAPRRRRLNLQSVITEGAADA
jgi:hypothetical protein